MDQEVQVMKSKSVTADRGIYTFDDVIIIGNPGTDILLSISSDAIKSSIIERANEGMVVKQIYFRGYLRYCTRGEYQSSDGKCIVCPEGFYTLEEDRKNCSECPEHS